MIGQGTHSSQPKRRKTLHQTAKISIESMPESMNYEDD